MTIVVIDGVWPDANWILDILAHVCVSWLDGILIRIQRLWLAAVDLPTRVR